MKKCVYCGQKFDLTSVKRSCGQKYGAGSYDEFFPDGDVCQSCADDTLGSALAAGREMQYYVYRDNDD